MDSCVTDGMTPSLHDFEPGTYKTTPPSSYVGSGGNGQILGYVTASYVVTSDDGIQYKMKVPNMAHSPTVPHRLLAPQYLKKIERIQR